MRPLGLILLFTAAAAAQVADGIVTTVSRTVAVTPDEADFTVTVGTTLDVTQQQLVQTFQDAGVENLNVTGVSVRPNALLSGPNTSQTSYQITFTTAPTAMKAYAKVLDQMTAKLPAGFLSLRYSAAQGASQAAVDSARQAILPQLLSDARTRAQALAAAAGLKLGAIQGVTESVNTGAVGLRSGDFSLSTFASFVFYPGPSGSGTQFTFSATVKFAAQ